MIRGVDVYDGQGDIDWQAVFDSGVSFAIIKATEGTGNVQSTFPRNRQAAPAAGISPLGLYHFGRPENGNPEAQADHYLSVIGALGRDEFVALDVETGSVSSWPDFILRWFARIESRLGMVPCCLYLSDSPAGSMTIVQVTGKVNGEDERSSRPLPGRSLGAHVASTVARALAGTSCGQFSLWDAGYGANTGAPPAWGTGFESKYHGPFEHSWNVGPWSTWTIWQFSSVGRVPGIGNGRVNVDVNLAPDDLRARLGFADSPPVPPPDPPKEPEVSKIAFPADVPSGESRRVSVPAIGGGFGWTKAAVTFSSPGVDVRRAVVGPNERAIGGLAPDGVASSAHFDGRGYVDLVAGDEWIEVDLDPSPVGTLDLLVEASDAP